MTLKDLKDIVAWAEGVKPSLFLFSAMVLVQESCSDGPRNFGLWDLAGSPLLKAFERWEPLLWKLVDEDGSGFVSPAELNMAAWINSITSS